MIHFYKYQGAGNDFVIIDNRLQNLNLSQEQVAKLCHRKYGIGADGLMLLEASNDAHFKMVYYNADGNESTMCGNGGRCICAFAQKLGLVTTEAHFVAIDGRHYATWPSPFLIALEMNNVTDIQHFQDHSILNTGSPHYVSWQLNVAQVDVFAQGRSIRNLPTFAPKGINVNFAERTDEGLFVRTYERGVEDETLSCGTGVTACAIAASGNQLGHFITKIKTPGGPLQVAFTKDNTNTAINVVLTGPATFVFQGHIQL